LSDNKKGRLGQKEEARCQGDQIWRKFAQWVIFLLGAVFSQHFGLLFSGATPMILEFTTTTPVLYKASAFLQST
jgi:hypothetical protein